MHLWQQCGHNLGCVVEICRTKFGLRLTFTRKAYKYHTSTYCTVFFDSKASSKLQLRWRCKHVRDGESCKSLMFTYTSSSRWYPLVLLVEEKAKQCKAVDPNRYRNMVNNVYIYIFIIYNIIIYIYILLQTYVSYCGCHMLQQFVQHFERCEKSYE